MSNLEKTAFGKAIKTFIWVGVSTGLIAVASYVTDNKELFNPIWVAAANTALVFLKNLVDPKVRNF